MGFNRLVFVILFVLIYHLPKDPEIQVSLASGLLLYLAAFPLVFIQNRLIINFFQLSKGVAEAFVQLEFLVLFYLISGDIPNTLLAEAVWILFAAPCYLLLLFLFHVDCYFLLAPHRNKHEIFIDAAQEIRWLLPFFILLILLFEVLHFAKTSSRALQEELSFIPLLIILLSVFLILLFPPPLALWMWGCRPLDPSPLKDALVSFAHKAHFKNPKFYRWTILSHRFTASIIGVFPPLRYILFTDRLLNTLAIDSVVAVAAHEIAHSKGRHLLLLVFVFAGGLLPIVFFKPSTPAFTVLYVIFLLLYVKYVVGYFLNLFERQADLFGSKVGVPPQAMIDVLHRAELIEGNGDEMPGWHHFGLKERIDFLERVKKSPELVLEHDKKVRRSITVYLIGFSLVAILLVAWSFIK